MASSQPASELLRLRTLVLFLRFPLFFSTVSEILFADERLDRRAASEQVVENEEELKIQGAKNPVVKCTF